jgi:hypothetical protein
MMLVVINPISTIINHQSLLVTVRRMITPICLIKNRLHNLKLYALAKATHVRTETLYKYMAALIGKSDLILAPAGLGTFGIGNDRFPVVS